MVAISRLQFKDIKDFVSLWNQGYEVLTSSKFLMTEEKAKSGFTSKMFDYYGIYNDDKLVGFMLLKENNKELWIKHMLIDKNSQNKGMGKMLLDVAIGKAKKGSRRIRVEVLNDNKKALNFFIKNDFKITALEGIQSVLELI